jgi:diguanylate cyclase (GGDEF)-like protein
VKVLIEHQQELEESMRAEESRVRRGSSARAERMQGLLDRIATAHTEIYSLQEISRTLGKTLELEESLGLIVGRLECLLHFAACVIYLADAEEPVLRPRFARGAAASRLLDNPIPLGQRVAGRVALQRGPRAVSVPPAPPASPRWDGCRSDLEPFAEDPVLAGLASTLAAPLVVDDELVGVIALYDDARREYTPHDAQLLAMMASHVACSVRAGLVLERTRENALTDALTGLPNARYLRLAFDREVLRAHGTGRPLSLLRIEVDGLDAVNEADERRAGDRLVTEIGRALRASLGVPDTCARNAADEFVALLPGVGPEGVAAVAARLADAVRSVRAEARPGRTPQSLSFGWATAPADGADLESLMESASSRLREEKRLKEAGATLAAAARGE